MAVSDMTAEVERLVDTDEILSVNINKGCNILYFSGHLFCFSDDLL